MQSLVAPECATESVTGLCPLFVFVFVWVVAIHNRVSEQIFYERGQRNV
jgi:hypothetical protein